MAISLNGTATINVNAPHLATFASQINQVYGQLNQMPGQWQRVNSASIIAMHNMRQATAAMMQNTSAAVTHMNTFSASMAKASYNMKTQLIQPMMNFFGSVGHGLAAVGGAAGRGIGAGAGALGAGAMGAGRWLTSHPTAASLAAAAGGGANYRSPRGTFGRGAFFAGGIGGMVRGFRGFGLGGMAAGMLGSGSLYGLASMASEGSSRRSYYQGIGSDYGFSRSFPLAYNGIIDGKSFMSAVGGAQMEPGGAAYSALSSLGLNVSGSSTANLSRQALLEFRRRTAGMSIGEIGNFYRGSGLESTMSPTDFRRMVTMKEPEFQEKFMKDIHDENALGIEDKTMKAWQDLNTHLKTMSELVSKSLYQAFEALIPGLTRFSQGLTNAFTVIMDSPFMKRMIRGSGKILNRLGEIVDSETSTKEKVESAAGLGKSLTDEFLGAHWKVAEWLWKKGIDNGMGVQVRGAPWGGVPGAIPDTKSGWDRIGDSIARWIGVGTGTGTNVGNAGVGGGGGGAAARALGRIYSGSSTANIPNDFNFATQGWNSEQMASARAIAGAEANWNPKEGGTGYLSMGKVTPSGDQAYGLYQVMGANIPGWTEKHLKRRMTPTEFLNDPAAQDKVFQEEFGGYLRQYGNLRDAVSMWKSGKPWELGQNLSDPTAGDNVRQYWDKVRGLYNQQPNVTKLEVTVLNKSGNNIVVNTAVGANNTGSYNIPA